MPKKMKPCIVCGGVKERGYQGSRLCFSCRSLPKRTEEFIQREREYSRRRRRNSGIPERRKKIRDDGFVWCNECENYLPPIVFPNHSNKNKGMKNHHRYAPYCKPCQKKYNRRRRLKNIYGLSLEKYDELLSFQNGVCFICHRNDFRYSLAVDHDHKTGEVRGLLCKGCNRDLLGALHDNIEALKRAIDYLENPPARRLQDREGH